MGIGNSNGLWQVSHGRTLITPHGDWKPGRASVAVVLVLILITPHGDWKLGNAAGRAATRGRRRLITPHGDWKLENVRS